MSCCSGSGNGSQRREHAQQGHPQDDGEPDDERPVAGREPGEADPADPGHTVVGLGGHSRVRGSSRALTRSVTRLARMIQRPMSRTQAWSTGKSRPVTDWTTSWPMPGSANTFSTMIEPPMRPATLRPIMVTVEVSELRST